MNKIDTSIFVSSDPEKTKEILADIKDMNAQTQSLENEKSSLKGRSNQSARRRISRKILKLKCLVTETREKLPPLLFDEKAAAQDVMQSVGFLSNFNDVKAKVMKRLETANHPSDAIAWMLDDLVKAEVRRDNVKMIVARLDHICENKGVSSEDDFTLAMVREVVNGVRKDVERDLLRGDTPSSSSHAHNAVGLATIEAKGNFLQDLKWHVESDIEFYEKERERLGPVPTEN